MQKFNVSNLASACESLQLSSDCTTKCYVLLFVFCSDVVIQSALSIFFALFFLTGELYLRLLRVNFLELQHLPFQRDVFPM